MSHLFAYLSRMKFIERWGLMHNVHTENIQEHSLQVCMIAHALVLIHNREYGGNLNAERVVFLAMFHDASEVITGDLPTPIKYFSPKIKTAYKEIERIANQRLLDMVPDAFKEDYRPAFFEQEEDKPLWRMIKVADKISAYLKCVEERKAGNQEFSKAETVLRSAIDEMDSPEATYFMDQFAPSIELTLDELE